MSGTSGARPRNPTLPPPPRHNHAGLPKRKEEEKKGEALRPPPAPPTWYPTNHFVSSPGPRRLRPILHVVDCIPRLREADLPQTPPPRQRRPQRRDRAHPRLERKVPDPGRVGARPRGRRWRLLRRAPVGRDGGRTSTGRRAVRGGTRRRGSNHDPVWVPRDYYLTRHMTTLHEVGHDKRGRGGGRMASMRSLTARHGVLDQATTNFSSIYIWFAEKKSKKREAGFIVASFLSYINLFETAAPNSMPGLQTKQSH